MRSLVREQEMACQLEEVSTGQMLSTVLHWMTTRRWRDGLDSMEFQLGVVQDLFKKSSSLTETTMLSVCRLYVILIQRKLTS